MTYDEDSIFSVPAVDWQDWGAACEGEDLSLFFAPNYFETQSGKKAREAKAKLICRACPVQPECLEFALVASKGHGVWGGFNERERRKIVFTRAQAAALTGMAEIVA